jgi:chemotaxis protein methyltransferase WspC
MAQVELENLLKRNMGLDAASIGSSAIERAVRGRMASFGLKHADDYWRELRESSDELQELIEAVVVPETWFFRDPQAFAALVRLLAAGEWRSAPPAGIVRLLSIPCSTGEEPYSMVMSLLDGGFPAEQLHVDAADISAHALDRARRGIFGSNSFRGENLAFRDRYFQLTPGGYSLAGPIRRHVTFNQKNLFSSDFGFQQELYDIIFCRNLLIYFDRSTQERAMKILGRLLAPGGFLFVGPAEAFLASASGFTSVNQAMSFAFQKTGSKPACSVLPLRNARKPVKREPPVRVHDNPRSNSVAIPVPISLGLQAVNLDAARRLADAGQLREAAALCDAHLAERGPSSDAYYLLGLVRDASGDSERAGACYQRAVYLEPEHVEALMHLALLKEARGDFGSAGRLRDRARRVETRSGVNCL